MRDAFQLEDDTPVNTSHVSTYALRYFYFHNIKEKVMAANGNILGRINADRFLTDVKVRRGKKRTIIDAAQELLHSIDMKNDIAEYYNVPILTTAKKIMF